MTQLDLWPDKHFEHDCDKCIFLGSTKGSRGVADLYFCKQGEVTVIARYGDDGPDYNSGLTISYGKDACVTVARMVAEQRGLLETED